jgi:hypothetical protein
LNRLARIPAIGGVGSGAYSQPGTLDAFGEQARCDFERNKMREEQEPTLVDSDSVLGDRYDHPAYGCISCSRISGHASLVGSELQHQHYIRLSVSRAKKYRSFHEDRFFGNQRDIVEVYLSEHQWASFVASMNLGSSVPCTIGYGPPDECPIEMKPAIKEPNKHDLSQKELKDYASELVQDMRAELAKLEELASASGSISKVALRERLKTFGMAVQGVCSNLPFHVDQHKEMMEKNVQAAKSDVEGYITGMAATIGLEALRKMAPQLEQSNHRQLE